jgi:hypothetical protein
MIYNRMIGKPTFLLYLASHDILPYGPREGIFFSNQPKPDFLGVNDILGCRETQVQRNIVDKQLQMIFERDLV